MIFVSHCKWIHSQMHLSGLDHINIVAPKEVLDRVLAFYTGILNLIVGERPDVEPEGYWLYIDNKPIVHLAVGDSVCVGGDNALHHVAFKASNLDEAITTLDNHDINYHKEDLGCLNLTQIFFFDPVGIRIELGFNGDN